MGKKAVAVVAVVGIGFRLGKGQGGQAGGNLWKVGGLKLCRIVVVLKEIQKVTRQSKQCGFSIYIFDNSK